MSKTDDYGYVWGSQANYDLAKAADDLSWAKGEYKRCKQQYSESHALTKQWANVVEMYQKAYDYSFRLYTNPFNTVKSVDARYPNAPK